MKKLLVLPLIMLSFCVFASDRVILWSFEQDTLERVNFLASSESSLKGYGLKFYNFPKPGGLYFGIRGLYYGAGFSYLKGERNSCVRSNCISLDINGSVFNGEIGKQVGRWTPFIGMSVSRSEEEIHSSHSLTDETWGLSAGLWLELDRFKLRGSIKDIDDRAERAIFGGVQFQMDNSFAVGAEFGMLLDDQFDRVRFSLQFGRSF